MILLRQAAAPDPLIRAETLLAALPAEQLAALPVMDLDSIIGALARQAAPIARTPPVSRQGKPTEKKLPVEALATKRLALTPLRQADADAMVDVLGDPRLHQFIGGRPASHAELHDRYGMLAAGSPHPDQIWLNWIVRRRVDDKPIGTVQATVNRGPDAWTAHVAWVIGLLWHGQGFATEAARALVDWLREQGAATVTAAIHPDHHASAKVAARAGLTLTDEEVDGERLWRTPSP